MSLAISGRYGFPEKRSHERTLQRSFLTLVTPYGRNGEIELLAESDKTFLKYVLGRNRNNNRLLTAKP